jgi:DNA-binding transcriptional MerR regulator
MIPNKSNFKFQELTPITGVKPYVIRFWETEFPIISPVTSDSGQKLYARKDVEAILTIKKLLFEDKMTIPEAKAALTGLATEEEEFSEVLNNDDEIRKYLIEAVSLIQDIKQKRNW